MKPFNAVICLILCFCISNAFSQSLTYYNSPQDDANKYKEWIDATDKRYKSDVLAHSGKNKKYFEDIFKSRYENIKKMYDRKELITETVANGYLQGLLQEIIKSNQTLGSLETRVAFSRAWWPNASSLGEGTILFNIGLFYKLQNESQAAFVLCHELAHLYLNHGNNAIDRYVNTVYSDEFQKELKKINESQYQKNQQLEKLARTITFDSRQHSREHEAQADSMAVEWLKNTSFDIRESLTCLALLDSIDVDKYNITPALNRIFNFQEYPFQARWTQEERSLFNTLAASTEQESQKERDSLKTHPDCSKRISLLKDKVGQYYKPNSRVFVVNEKEFKQLRRDFDYEIIDYLYRSEDITRSLHFTLQMLETQPANPYLIINTGRCINKLFTAQKNHTLNKVADMPSPFNDKDYNALLEFLQRVRLTDLGAFSYYFLLHNQNTLMSNEDFMAALIDSKANFNKPDEKQALIDMYKKQFPSGKYHF
ncbi:MULTISPECIES: M48 family metalloprotease [Niastella]|uniref:M48 family metalloprotease n=1 Tax=Niastella soli TaxID=2821487 RepID=A0ABS3YPR3_9BACT|nr:M48 family metalloprotease [Niastella soli]MBO9199889.1 M48 family metalloprotease [Niastella soli]